MILESASLQVRPGQSAAFEAAFAVARRIISSMPGYRSHELRRCLEREGHYLLLVRWDSVAAHEEGFRKSPQYQEWRALLHHFYDPFPTVLHYEAVAGAGMAAPASSIMVTVGYRAQPGKGDEAQAALGKLVATVLATEPACLGIEILRHADDPERILLHERWTGREAYEGPHMSTPHLREFIAGAPAFLAGPPEISVWREG